MKIEIAFPCRLCAMPSMVATLLVFVLAASVSAVESRSRRLLIVGQGPDGHPPATHEFMPGAEENSRKATPAKQ
jgi:hypothetical protein